MRKALRRLGHGLIALGVVMLMGSAGASDNHVPLPELLIMLVSSLIVLGAGALLTMITQEEQA